MATPGEVTAATILQQTSSFLDQLLTRPDLRHRILSSARLKLPSPLHPTLLQSLTLLNSSTSPSSASASAAEKLLSARPVLDPLSSLLLSLAHAHRRRHVSAALSLLDLFVLDPSLARSELAPPLYEALFVPHLLPAIRWFSDLRSRIISHGKFVDADDTEDATRSIAFEAMSVLSRMSGGQAEELRELEKGYENAMDRNCRIYAGYLKKVLEGSDGSSPPQLVFTMVDGEYTEVEDDDDGGDEEANGMSTLKGRYNNVIPFLPTWLTLIASTFN